MESRHESAYLPHTRLVRLPGGSTRDARAIRQGPGHGPDLAARRGRHDLRLMQRAGGTRPAQAPRRADGQRQPRHHAGRGDIRPADRHAASPCRCGERRGLHPDRRRSRAGRGGHDLRLLRGPGGARAAQAARRAVGHGESGGQPRASALSARHARCPSAGAGRGGRGLRRPSSARGRCRSRKRQRGRPRPQSGAHAARCAARRPAGAARASAVDVAHALARARRRAAACLTRSALLGLGAVRPHQRRVVRPRAAVLPHRRRRLPPSLARHEFAGRHRHRRGLGLQHAGAAGAAMVCRRVAACVFRLRCRGGGGDSGGQVSGRTGQGPRLHRHPQTARAAGQAGHPS